MMCIYIYIRVCVCVSLSLSVFVCVYGLCMCVRVECTARYVRPRSCAAQAFLSELVDIGCAFVEQAQAFPLRRHRADDSADFAKYTSRNQEKKQWRTHSTLHSTT